MLNAYSLEQAVNFPTNFHCGELKACPVLVATNFTDLCVSSLAPLGKADNVVLKGVFPGPHAMPSKLITLTNVSFGAGREQMSMVSCNQLFQKIGIVY